MELKHSYNAAYRRIARTPVGIEERHSMASCHRYQEISLPCHLWPAFSYLSLTACLSASCFEILIESAIDPSCFCCH